MLTLKKLNMIKLKRNYIEEKLNQHFNIYSFTTIY